MGYTLPVAVDTYPKSFNVPAAQIPAGAVGTAGVPWLQFNQYRCGLWITNITGAAGSIVWISEKQFGFASAFPLVQGTIPGIVEWPFPSRIQLYAWQTVAAPDFRYMEFIYQPFRQGVSPEQGGGIRSNVQPV